MKKIKELYKKKLFQEVIDLCETEISINQDSINYLEIMADSYIALKKNIHGIEISPKKGKALIWPSDWTHSH